ncbi:tyrosine-type recombinase/integrase [Limnohabitans lacus]|uniref:Site-specific integrase n=1 Tax=Limnohabitans lacus TaxID=3045173 RepID=A0ABT6X6J2_9BURK|nr:tyrosine-type recombinase/integrase [Limnohabitans sp. HM2-2]MDI9233713.1 site-specific integrase [Limnohabitans sp. HM2-2]
MALKVPRLAKSRNGVFFVRVLWRDATGKRHIKQISLQTKQPALARVLALKFNFEIEATHPMGIKKIPDLLGLNPMTQKMATKGEMKLQRTPWAEFDDGDIKALFCADYPQKMDKPDFYWLPLIALFSGARLGELARLELSTFREVDGVKCFRIVDGKTLESRRTVPIHSQLLALGLWDYAQALKDKGETFLIPHRPQDPPGTPKNIRTRDPEKMTGRQWGKWVDMCGLKDNKKVFHSFRSTAITDLHNTEAKVAAVKRSVGHTSPEMAGVHGNSYVRGIALKNLQTAVEHLTHSQVDFQALKLQDPTFAAFFAHEEAKKNSPEAIERAQKLARYEKAKAEREERNRDKRKKQN